MMHPVVFSDDELKARHQFARFFSTHFELAYRSKHFGGALESASLLELFSLSQISYRHSAAKLDLHQLEHLLLFGGYSNKQDVIEIQCDVKVDMFPHFNGSVQLMLLDLVLPKIGMILRQSLDVSDSPDIQKAYLPESIRLFYQTMIFPRKTFQWWGKIPTKYNRISVAALYEAYVRYCDNCQLIPLAKKSLLGFLVNQGYGTTRGYYGGAQGVSVIQGIAMPWGEDLEGSLLGGLGQIVMDDHVCFNDNQTFNRTKDADMYAMHTYITERNRATYEQKGKTQRSPQIWQEPAEEQRQDLENLRRRADEAGTDADSGRASGTESADDCVSNAKAQQDTHEYAQNQIEDAQSYHGGDQDTEGYFSGAAIVSGVDYAETGDDITAYPECADDDIDGVGQNDGSDVAGSETATVEDELRIVEQKERERDVWRALKADVKLWDRSQMVPAAVAEFIREYDVEIYSKELVEKFCKDLRINFDEIMGEE